VGVGVCVVNNSVLTGCRCRLCLTTAMLIGGVR